MTILDDITDRVRSLRLPRWASWDDGYVVVDPTRAYPEYLERLKFPLEYAETNQYWIEVARRCFTEDLRLRLDGPFKMRIARTPGWESWRLDKWPAGAGADAGAAEWRRWHNRLI